MRAALLRIMAVPVEGPRRFRDWARALGPLVAPLGILVCGVRGELLGVALCWMGFIVPGVLAVNLFFPATHPLGRGSARPGVASVLAMLPFGVLSWTGCTLHWTLTRVLIAYAALYVLLVGVLAYALVRRGPAAGDDEGASGSFPLAPTPPRWAAAALLVLIGAMMVGACLAAPPPPDVSDYERFTPAKRPDWWHGVLLGFAASAAGAIVVFRASRRREDPTLLPAAPDRRSPRRGKADRRAPAGRQRNAPVAVDWSGLTAALLWLASAGLTVYLMLFVFSMSSTPMPKGRQALPWNVDDVAYVCEAVDYQYGYPLGKYEPSIGSDHGMARSGLSPLLAPLVATIARVTGVSCPALHHSVMPPLAVLLSSSCTAAALMVLFRRHRLLVPLGLLLILMAICKTWDYSRCLVEMLVYRAMQPKALHLSLLHPLQLATLLLLVMRPNRLHLGASLGVAIVGHLVHPLATIMGMVWSTTMIVAGLVLWRKAVPALLVVLVAYAGLAGEYRWSAKRPLEKAPPPSGRVAGSPIQSRDLVRVDTYRFTLDPQLRPDLDDNSVSPKLAEAFTRHDQPVTAGTQIAAEDDDTWVIEQPGGGYRVVKSEEGLEVFEIAAAPAARLDPFWSFGCNTLFHLGALAVMVLLAFGRQRREVLCVGLLGAAVLLATNVEPLGRLLNVALPTSIFWRARWMVPSLVNVAGLGAVLYWAVLGLSGWRGEAPSAGRSAAACAVALGAFILLFSNTHSTLLKVAEPPRQLTKFSEDMHKLVDLLGGAEAAPFVWGTFTVHHELPQLMPHLRLVFSRDKWMRVADFPQYRELVGLVFNSLSRGRVPVKHFQMLLQLYPIDHVVIDSRLRSAEPEAEFLETLGWRSIGRAGIYEVYQSPDQATAEPIRN